MSYTKQNGNKVDYGSIKFNKVECENCAEWYKENLPRCPKCEFPNEDYKENRFNWPQK